MTMRPFKTNADKMRIHKELALGHMYRASREPLLGHMNCVVLIRQGKY